MESRNKAAQQSYNKEPHSISVGLLELEKAFSYFDNFYRKPITLQ